MHGSIAVDIDKEIMARIDGAKAWDKDSKPEDFQIKAAKNGYVLINLKTRRAQLIYDEDSELCDFRKLFPNIIPFPASAEGSAQKPDGK